MPAVRNALIGLVSGFAATLVAAVLLTSGATPEPALGRAPDLRAPSVPFVCTTGDDGAAFVAATFAGMVRVTAAGAVEYLLPGGARLCERPSRAPAAVTGGPPSPTRVNVLRGADPARWRRGLATHDSVLVTGLEDGVDLVVAAGLRNVEKRFRVAPGADPGSIRMRFEGAVHLELTPDGRLSVTAPDAALSFTEPVAYQDAPDGRRPVAVRYVVDGDAYGFAVSGRDPALPVVIDPLIASTYVGGATAGENLLNDWIEDVAVYAGSVYVAGATQADVFPNGYDGPRGVVPYWQGGYEDAFVCRLSDDLETVEAVTYLGGADDDKAFALHVTSDGVFVVGDTRSTDFPTTAGSHQPAIAGDGRDAFVTRLSHDLGTLTASTFLGGDAADTARDVVVTPDLGVFVAGSTRSADLGLHVPEMVAAYQRGNAGVNDAFVMRFAKDLSTVTHGTLYGGRFSDEPNAMAVAGGDVVICGSTSSQDLPLTQGAFDTGFANEGDGFVARFDTDLTELRAGTYLGGDEAEYPYDVCRDVGFQGGDILVFGDTSCADFPSTGGTWDPTRNGSGPYLTDDAFVVRMSWDLTTLRAGTFVGGSESESASRMVIHEDGIVLLGGTYSTDFPMLPGSDDVEIGGTSDMYVVALTPDLATAISTRFLGGELWETGKGLALSGSDVFVAGDTYSREYPTTSGAFDEDFNDELNRADGFVSRLGVFKAGAPPTVIDAYILPKRLDVKHNARKPERSWLNAGGWFDTGSGAVDWTKPGSLTIGERRFDVPGLAQLRTNKQWWEWREGDLYFRIKPSRYGSSKGKFKLKWKDAGVASIPTDAPLLVRFENGDVDAIGEVALSDGRYQLGRQRGALVQPRLALYSCKTTIQGAGKDALRARLGLCTTGGIPQVCPPLTFALDDHFEDSIDSAELELRKRKFVYKGPPGGLSKATVDFGKEKLAIVGKKIDVGAYPEGPQAVSVLVQVGDDGLELRVRMVRKGRIMRY